MNTKNNKTNEPRKFVLNLTQRLDLRSSSKHFVLHNLPIYYTWKNIRQQYKNSEHRIVASTWNDEFYQADSSYSVSNIRDYLEYIIKTKEILSTNLPICIHNNRINNRISVQNKRRIKTWIENN